MEHAPLRPVPARPAGPVPDPVAARRVAASLPSLEGRDALALALVALAGHPRAEVGHRLALTPEELSQALARARKELRRTLTPLPGSGWCERAERLVSDRLDGELAARDEVRLGVHLRNCPRCVEHERRLVQATDALLAELPAAPAPPSLAPAAEPELAVVEPSRDAAPAELEPVAAWYALIAVSLLLAVAAIVLAIAGAA